MTPSDFDLLCAGASAEETSRLARMLREWSDGSGVCTGGTQEPGCDIRGGEPAAAQIHRGGGDSAREQNCWPSHGGGRSQPRERHQAEGAQPVRGSGGSAQQEDATGIGSGRGDLEGGGERLRRIQSTFEPAHCGSSIQALAQSLGDGSAADLSRWSYWLSCCQTGTILSRWATWDPSSR